MWFEVATSGKKLQVAASLMNCNWPSLDTSIATKQIIADDDDDHDDNDDSDTWLAPVETSPRWF